MNIGDKISKAIKEGKKVRNIYTLLATDDEQNRLTIVILTEDDPEKEHVFGKMTTLRNEIIMKDTLVKILRIISPFCDINTLHHKIGYNYIAFTIKNYKMFTLKYGNNSKHFKINIVNKSK